MNQTLRTGGWCSALSEGVVDEKSRTKGLPYRWEGFMRCLNMHCKARMWKCNLE